MVQRPADEFSDPDAADDVTSASRSAPSGRGARWDEPEPWSDDPDDGGPDDVHPDEASPHLPAPRRRRRRVLLAGCGLAVLIVATGGVLHAQERDRRTPEAAVLEYVELIEAGDVEAATELVPVLGHPEDADGPPSSLLADGARRPPVVPLERLQNPAVLTNLFYADNPGLSVLDVERDAGRDADPGVGENVGVTVSYSVDDAAASAVLRVEREPDSALGLPVWRVLDALTVPLVVDVSDGGLGTAYVDGARVAVSGQRAVPQFGSMLYPGVYTVTFDGGSYLEAADVERRVATPGPGADPTTSSSVVSLTVLPTAAAHEAIMQEITAFLERCATTTEGLDLCPEPYRSGEAASDAATVRVGQQPFSFGIYSYPAGKETVQMISGSTRGTVTYPGEGRSVTEPFSLTYDFAVDDVEPRAQIRSSDPDGD